LVKAENKKRKENIENGILKKEPKLMKAKKKQNF
jgi:hypothetical protein